MQDECIYKSHLKFDSSQVFFQGNFFFFFFFAGQNFFLILFIIFYLRFLFIGLWKRKSANNGCDENAVIQAIIWTKCFCGMFYSLFHSINNKLSRLVFWRLLFGDILGLILLIIFVNCFCLQNLNFRKRFPLVYLGLCV